MHGHRFGYRLGNRGLLSSLYSKIQLITVKEFLEGKVVQCPQIIRRDSSPTFKKAPRAEKTQKKSKEKQSRLSEHR